MLTDRDNLLQRRRNRRSLPRNGQALDSSRRTGSERDARRRNAECARDQPDQLGIRLALARRCAYPCLEDAAPVGERLNAVDGVATAARSESDRQRDTAWHHRPGPGRHASKHIRYDVEPDNAANEYDDEDQDQWRKVDPAKIRHAAANRP